MIDQVRRDGFLVIDDVESHEDVSSALIEFGRMMPQYDGNLTYEVKAQLGFDDRAYSKSRNEIRAHTEAPGWNPPPKYLALWCRVQARGEGGETCLADVRAYLKGFEPPVVERLRSHDIAWGGTNTSGTGSAGVVAPMLTTDESGDEVLRFSYNLLTSGEYDPELGRQVPVERLPWGQFGFDLAHQVHEHFREAAHRISIPKNAVLVWDNHRLAHARTPYTDARRHLIRYWLAGA
ncbi:TauD/TfdA family dioxygenase [Micromonospora sp. NPDC023888]|uniref:TauD/TfdA family dioxygenase n=1 Tax=Micromonospora sp. NPDC023888 TaxID=3155607 RepID=UPI00340FD242